jgi:hypothetical protein
MITDTLIYDTLCEVMDQVSALDKKVTRLLSAAGIDEPEAVPDAGGERTG